MNYQQEKSKIAAELLRIRAVFLSPQKPFTWASGIKSPIYCDNRLVLSDVAARTAVESGLYSVLKEFYPQTEIIMGTSTAGIAHAAYVSEMAGLPMGYVRSSNKDHGLANRIEGKIEKGQKTVIVEDLISTAGSVISTAEALREAGADVLGVVSIFTYGLQKGTDNLKAAGIENHSLCDLDALLPVAVQTGYITADEAERILRFRDDPADESWMEEKL